MTKQATPPPRGDKPAPTAPPPPPPWRHWLWLFALIVFVGLFFVLPATRMTPSVTLTYSHFLKDVSAKNVKTITISSSGNATGTLANGKHYITVIPLQLAGSSLLTELQKEGVQITATASTTSFGDEVLTWVILLLPFVIIGWLWVRLSRRGGGGALQGVMGVGRSRAKVFDADRPSTTFADVAGYTGAKREIAEVVEFLRSPERYRRAGAVAPRGVLMVGPPGTGKTLLARAVAGEASVPFFSVSGSSFVEMFVGVGAARVRDLFAEARKRAPAIIFVDEVDAIGQRRSGAGAIVSNDEREQTLNQLLSEMDGFDPSEGIVVLAATNRPEILDPALLRPGRFDRQVTIPLPTLMERVAILQVHARGKRLAPSVDLEVVARGTPGFSGADLANLVNEAAIVAVRHNREVLEGSDFDEARDRLILGRREGSNVLLPEEKHAVAVHEAGHALVAAYSPGSDPVAKITILPAGQALGVTEQLPLVERHLFGEDYLHTMLAVRLGGRAAELVELGQGSTGAANDLASATELAIKMVREFGLSKELGPVGYPEGGSAFLGGGGAAFSSRPFAEETQAKIDVQVGLLLSQAEKRAVELLTQHRQQLRELADLLVAHETVDGSEVYRIAGVAQPTAPDSVPGLEPVKVASRGKSSVAAGTSPAGQLAVDGDLPG
jgi:cell division protease FtsH